jgi:hypothetical protein
LVALVLFLWLNSQFLQVTIDVDCRAYHVSGAEREKNILLVWRISRGVWEEEA